MPFRHRPALPLAVLAVLALVAASCGSSKSSATSHDVPGVSTSGTSATGGSVRTVDVTMADIKFDPELLSVKKGEAIRLVFHNQGKLAHEAIIGDAAGQDAHEQEMAPSGGSMDMHGSGALMVAAGATGELTHTFNDTGAILIGCHEPGHYAAGMKIAVTVT